MNTTHIEGNWEFNWTDGSGAGSPPEGNWRKATVPGDAHLDLVAHGLLEEPLTAWPPPPLRELEHRAWFYRTAFDFRPPAGPFAARLVFEGLDGVARVELNGRELGKTENSFIAHSFEVSGLLRPGRNSLLVVIGTGLREAAGRELARYRADSPRPWLRKPQFTFGWDWSRRLVTCGIWRRVRLETATSAFFDDLHVRAVPESDFRRARVAAAFACRPVPGAPAPAPLRAVVSRRGVTVAESRLRPVPGRNECAFEIENPVPWWPSGEGEPALYDFTLAPVAGDGPAAAGTRFGIRSVRLEQKKVSRGGKTFVLRVNGRAVFCRGANWVPADSIPARVDDAKTDHLLEEAVRANFNMLRVWGGGIYESERFYRRCDELGIMIWQDFMYACGLYPDDDPGFLENCTREAEAVLRRLRNHPCIVTWCGNNEIHEGWHDVNRHQGLERFFGSRIWDEILPRLVRRLSPGSIYRPSSPWGGAFPRDDQEGNCHCLSIGITRDRSTDIELACQAIGRFNTEFYTWCSPPSAEAMKRYLPPEQFRFASDAYRHHANDVFEKRELAVAARYITEEPGELPLEVYAGAMQRLHGEHMARLIGAFRRNMNICRGALFWMYNDCWPVSSWTVHDYWVERKALYHYIRRVYAPVTVGFRPEEGGLSAWVSNLSAEPFSGRLVYGRYEFAGGRALFEKEAEINIGPGRAKRGAFFHTTRNWPWTDLSSFAAVRLLDGRGETVARDTFFFTTWMGLAGEGFNFPPSFWEKDSLRAPAITLRRRGDRELEASTDAPAFSIRLDADACLPDDNFFDLLPGERKTVRFERPLPRSEITVDTLNDIILFLRNRVEKKSRGEGTPKIDRE